MMGINSFSIAHSINCKNFQIESYMEVIKPYQERVISLTNELSEKKNRNPASTDNRIQQMKKCHLILILIVHHRLDNFKSRVLGKQSNQQFWRKKSFIIDTNQTEQQFSAFSGYQYPTIFQCNESNQ